MIRILIIDDSEFMRGILKDLLSEHISSLNAPIEIHEAGGKKEALNILKTVHPDVILLDIVMKESELEGLEFLEEAKSIFPVNKIAVISSVGQASVIDRCKQLGIANYLQKPFKEKEIIDAINNITLLVKYSKD